MRIQASSLLQRLLPGSRARAALLAGAVVAISLAAVACSGADDDEPAATQASGGVATATATASEAASATSEPTRVGGTLVPLDTATPAPTTTSSGGAPPAPETVAMIDMTPCGDETYFEEVTLAAGIAALAYKDVPAGTPILFPFEQGRLLELDSREGATTAFYEVSDVGIFTIQVAGANSMDRNATHPVQGSVIGHFGGTFGEQQTEALPGYQLVAVAGTEELVMVGDEAYAGEALDPNVTDCLVLP
jgi:hypothetical protein